MQNNNHGNNNRILQFLLGCCGLRNRNHRNQQQNLPIRNLAPIQHILPKSHFANQAAMKMLT